MKNPDRQAVMMNDYQSFSFGNSICSPVLSAKMQQSPLNFSGLYLFNVSCYGYFDYL